MPSRSNPNTPSSSKRKAASTIKRNRQKRQHGRSIIAKSGGRAAPPRTSQELRRARPLSGKKARKVERKAGYDARRRLEEERRKGEVEMRDWRGKGGGGGGGGEGGEGLEEKMDLGEVE